MRVLVTGNLGYIGSVLAPTVAAAGHDVVGLDTGFYDGCDFGGEPDGSRRWRRTCAMSRPPTSRDSTRIVHLAALSNDPIGDLNEQWTYDINLEGTLHLARMAKEAGVERFVFASSCSMYGASDSDDLLDESAPFNPLTAYAESKVRAEQGLAELADDDFVPVSMRNATVYGVSPRLRLDIVLNNLAGWAHTTGADSPPQRRLVLAPAAPRARPVEGRRRDARSAARRSCVDGPSTSAATSRTTSYASSRRSSPR